MVSESSSASFLYVPSVGVDVFACVCDVDACGVGVNVCSVGTCIPYFLDWNAHSNTTRPRIQDYQGLLTNLIERALV